MLLIYEDYVFLFSSSLFSTVFFYLCFQGISHVFLVHLDCLYLINFILFNCISLSDNIYFKPLKYFEACFMIENLFCPSDCCMYTWEPSGILAFCCSWILASLRTLVSIFLKVFSFLLIFLYVIYDWNWST